MMFDWYNDWLARHDARSWEKWEREHRWDALANYNAEVARGLLHSAAYNRRMAQQQAAFNAEHGRSGRLFPIRLEASADDDYIL